ncbi:MAG: glycosyltransferase family 2 protein [Chloroflexota bacterium]
MNANEPTLAAAVITRDEERHLGDCLGSLAWADELLVFDSCSRDRTAEIALAHGARLQQRPFDDFARQRNAALAALRSDWVLFVDADERVTPALAAEARAAAQQSEQRLAAGQAAAVGYWVPRRNYVLGRWLGHGGWYPDHQLRLLRRGRTHYDEARPVHEVVVLDGEAAFVNQPLVHYNYQRLAQVPAKLSAYAALEVRLLHEQGVRGRKRSVPGRAAKEFWRRYVGLRGYRDGWQGLLLCTAVAFYTGKAYWQLWRAGSPSAARADEKGAEG